MYLWTLHFDPASDSRKCVIQDLHLSGFTCNRDAPLKEARCLVPRRGEPRSSFALMLVDRHSGPRTVRSVALVSQPSRRVRLAELSPQALELVSRNWPMQPQPNRAPRRTANARPCGVIGPEAEAITQTQQQVWKLAI
jgi:hypothetical protein